MLRQIVDPVDDRLLVPDAEVEHGKGEVVDSLNCLPVGDRAVGGVSFGQILLQRSVVLGSWFSISRARVSGSVGHTQTLSEDED